MIGLAEAWRRATGQDAPVVPMPWPFIGAYTPPRDPDSCTLDIEDPDNPGRCFYCDGQLPHCED